MLRTFYAHEFSPEVEYTFPLVRWVLNGLAILLVCGALFIGAAIAITIHAPYSELSVRRANASQSGLLPAWFWSGSCTRICLPQPARKRDRAKHSGKLGRHEWDNPAADARKVSESERAIVTARFANDVEAVNQ